MSVSLKESNMALLICKRVHIIVLNFSDMGCETVEKSCGSVLKGARFWGDT